jgi:uncharacterized protein YoxC
MPVTQGAALALFQETELTRHDIHLAMIFIGIIAFSLVVAAISTVITGMFAAKLLHRVDSIANIVEQRTGPILDRTNDLLRDLGPKIHTVTTNVEQISYTVQEINGRTRIHVAHVDGIVSDAIYATEELSQTVQQGIRGPLKQVAGVVAGLRAGLDTLIARSPFGRS